MGYHTISNNPQVKHIPIKPQTKQHYHPQWNPSRTPPTTLVTRSTKPPLVLPKRPTRLMRARTPHLLRAISRLLPTKHLTQSPRPMISLCNSTYERFNRGDEVGFHDATSIEYTWHDTRVL